MPGPVPIHTAVPAGDTQFIIAGSRPERRAIIIFNDSDEYLYLKYVTGISTDSFTIRVPPQWYGNMPWGNVYTGILYGMLAANEVGAFVQVTELVN